MIHLLSNVMIRIHVCLCVDDLPFELLNLPPSRNGLVHLRKLVVNYKLYCITNLLLMLEKIAEFLRRDALIGDVLHLIRL